jgi:hypothetical protein
MPSRAISTGAWGASCALALGAAACSVDTRSYTADSDTGSTHAFITVERHASMDGAELANALVAFVRIPASVDAQSAVRLVGFDAELPAMGQCSTDGQERSNSPPLNPLGRVEFLDAGDVYVRTDHAELKLAPHAFPTVTDLISGVVYATRDREAAPLPAEAAYGVDASGGFELDGIRISGIAPAMLEEVRVAGVELGAHVALPPGTPLDLTWAPGKPDDVVYAEFSNARGDRMVVCTFADEAGAGTLPVGSNQTSGQLTLHRLHVESPAVSFVGQAQLRFDFQVSAPVSFAR